MEYIKISIIVPVYNTETFLRECIDSILAQTHNNLEVILIDDGSTDSSPDICDEFKSDDRVIVKHIENNGVSNARNEGISIATGEYIGFVDSDDYIDKEMYKEMLESIKKYEAQMCAVTKYYSDNLICETSNIDGDCISGYEAIEQLLRFNFPTSLYYCLYHRDLIKNNLLDKEIHFWEDFEYLFRVLLNTDRISIISRPYYHYRIREESANSSHISDKSMSCLLIPPKAESIVRTKYPELLPLSLDLYLIMLYGQILKLAKTKNPHKKYSTELKAQARKHFRYNLKSKTKLKYRTAILLCAINPMISRLAYKITDHFR